jgi:hypothetical protein
VAPATPDQSQSPGTQTQTLGGMTQTQSG